MTIRPAHTPDPAGSCPPGPPHDPTAETPALDEVKTDNAMILQCSRCGDVAHRSVPAGWVVATSQLAGLVRFGVCPACVSKHYTFSVSDQSL